jgi:hypothetical protein
MKTDNTSVRHIFLYRVVDGKRQKFRFTIDAQMTIVTEEPCHENGVPFDVTEHLKSKNLQTEAAIAASPQLKQLKSRGFEFHISEGQVHLDHIPELELHIAQFYIPEVECPFPGCESLRAKYLAELAELQGGERVCSSCEIGDLQQKYRNVIVRHIQAAKLART